MGQRCHIQHDIVGRGHLVLIQKIVAELRQIIAHGLHDALRAPGRARGVGDALQIVERDHDLWGSARRRGDHPFVRDEAQSLGHIVEHLRAWQPLQATRSRRQRPCDMARCKNRLLCLQRLCR